LADLRESGAIEQDADIVCFIHRPEYYKITEDEFGNPTNGIAEIIVAKHRNGPTDLVRMKFDNEYAKFMNIDDNVVTSTSGKGYVEFSSKMNKKNHATMPSNGSSDLLANDKEPLPF